MGETLSVDTSGISDADGIANSAPTYQWIANDGTDDTDIQDATGSTYILSAADEGKTVKVRVSFTDDEGNQETRTSAPTAAVAATVPGAPGSLSVSVNDTGKLDVSWGAPESNGGSSVTGYRVQWKEAADSWDTPADVSETTVTGTSHTVTGLTDGMEIHRSGCLPSIQRETALPPMMQAELPEKPRLPPSRPQPWTVQR